MAKTTVLVIDNDATASGMMRRMMEESEFRLETAETLVAGLQRLAQPGIGLVVSELRLPDSPELESVTRIHARAPQIPIVIVTALEDQELPVAALRNGARDFILKRFLSREVLLRTLRRHLV